MPLCFELDEDSEVCGNFDADRLRAIFDPQIETFGVGERSEVKRILLDGEEDLVLKLLYEGLPDGTAKLEYETLKRLNGAKGHAPKALAFGMGRVDGGEWRQAIVMECVSGQPLQTKEERETGRGDASRCLDDLAGRRRLLSSKQVLDIVREIALASEACYRAGEAPDADGDSLGVHGALSPENIMVDAQERGNGRTVKKVILVGWRRDTGYIAPSSLGTCPEKACFSSQGALEGSVHDITMDVWSIGALAFWLRTREYPLDDDAKRSEIDLVGWLRQHGHELTWLDERLSVLIANCTQLDPDMRPQTPGKVASRANICDYPRGLIDELHKLADDSTIQRVASSLGMSVRIVSEADGRWDLEYGSEEEENLERLYRRLTRYRHKQTVMRHQIQRLRRLAFPLCILSTLAAIVASLIDVMSVTSKLAHVCSVVLCAFTACLSVVLLTLSLRYPRDDRRLGHKFVGVTYGLVCALSVFYGLSGVIGMVDGQWYARAGDELVEQAQYLTGDKKKDKLSQALGYIQQSVDKGNGDGLALLAKRYYSGGVIEQNYSKAFDLAEQSSDKGSAKGMGMLAVCFYNGYGVERSYDRAFELASKSAGMGDKRGTFCLATCYQEGHVPSDSDRGSKDENKKEAFNLFVKAAEQGYAPAECEAGRCLRFGWGTKQSDEHDKQAVQYFQRACDKNYVLAMAQLGDCYYWGKGVDTNYGRAREWYERSYAGGDGYGTYRLACCYYYGNSVVERDPNKAFELSKESADKGDYNGKGLLGCCYLYGKGTQKNEEEAVNIFKELADANDGYGEAALGDCYYHGNSVVKEDWEKAAQLYEASMKHGNPYGKAKYGYCLFYNYGKDKQKDREEAFSHFLAAADGGDSFGAGWVAYCCFYGYGTKQDYDRAFKYAKRAADENDSRGQRMLGVCYYYGRGGVAVNSEKALKLFKKASENGDNVATVWCGRCLLDKDTGTDSKEARGYFEQARRDGKDVSYGEATAWLAYCYLYRYEHLKEDKEAPKSKAEARNKAVSLLNEIPESQRTGFVYEILGKCYYYGYGGIEQSDQNKRTAVDLFIRACDEDKFTDEHGSALYCLGEAYHGGFGVARDDNRAKEMLRMAVLFGGDRYGDYKYVWQQATDMLSKWYGLAVADDDTLQQKS